MLSVTDTIPGVITDIRALPIAAVCTGTSLDRVLPCSPVAPVPVAAFGSSI
jgi:hypothetical protein